jgi:hypothetical protein
MTEKKVGKKVKEPTIAAEKIITSEKVIQPAAIKATVPVEVVELAKELKIDAATLLSWNVLDDRVVIISANGMKFSSAIKR